MMATALCYAKVPVHAIDFQGKFTHLESHKISWSSPEGFKHSRVPGTSTAYVYLRLSARSEVRSVSLHPVVQNYNMSDPSEHPGSILAGSYTVHLPPSDDDPRLLTLLAGYYSSARPMHPRSASPQRSGGREDAQYRRRSPVGSLLPRWMACKMLRQTGRHPARSSSLSIRLLLSRRCWSNLSTRNTTLLLRN